MTNPSVTQQVKFDAICMQFERAWRDGQNPAIESFVDSSSAAERPLLLEQLLLLELEYIEGTGKAPEVDVYLKRFPNNHVAVRSAFKAHSTAVAEANASSANRQPAGTIDQPIAERAGSQIGRYKLLEQIGEGGMGVVYMAEQQRPVRRKVALKIIKPGMDTKQVVARFEAERQTLAMMDHPNIARVLDAGSTESGRPYFVMELVRGTTITEYCDANKLDTDERLKLFKSVCQAVQHAHTKGIIHRDLKPSNALVTLHDGVPVPKIIDFGVSKAMGQQLTEKTMFTAFAQMVGTPLYMSPEQAEMSGLDIDTRSDIYSLGVLLYELLTGVTPFDRKRLHTAAFDELRRIIREEEPEKPSTRVSSLGESSATVSAQRSTDPTKLKQLLRGELDWIVMKTLEKDRNRRYETANALVAEVDRYLAGEPVNACPASTTYRMRKFANRYRAQVTVAAGFMAMLMISSVVAWMLYADARRARNDERAAKDEVIAAKEAVTAERDRALAAEKAARTERDRTEAQRQRADEHARELRTRLYDYNLSKAHAAYRDDDVVGVAKFLDDCTEEQRRWEWHHLRRLAGVPRELQVDTPAMALAASPTDPLYAVGNAEGRIQLLNEADGSVKWERPTGNRVVFPICGFSPDGKHLAVTHVSQDLIAQSHKPDPLNDANGGLQLWEVATGALVWEKKQDPGIIAAVAFSPNGRHLATWGGPSLSDLSIQYRDAETGAEIWSIAAQGYAASGKFSPDGQHLFLSEFSSAYVGAPSIIRCVNVADHSTVWSVSRSMSSLIAITNDGSRVIAGGLGPSVHVMDAATGKRLEELSDSAATKWRTDDPKNLATTIFLTRDDRFLVSRAFYSTTIWDLQKKQPVRTVRESFSESIRVGTLSHDNQSLATLDSNTTGSRILLTDLEPQPPSLVLAGHQKAVRGVTFTPDGKQILSTSFDGTLRTWNVTSGQEVDAKVVGGTLLAVAFSPLGDYFATGGEEGVCLWNAETREPMHRWPEASRVRSLQFSPDGQRLVAATYRSGHGLQLIDVGNGREVVERETERLVGAVFSSDGRRALSLNRDEKSGQLDLWDLESIRDPQIVRPSTGSVYAADLLLLPTGYDDRTDRVAAIIDNSIELWNVNTQKQLMTLHGHQDLVGCMAVNRDGSRLFSGDVLGVVRIWNLNTGEQLLEWQAHERAEAGNWYILRAVMSMALSPDGKTLATTGADGLVKLWETTRPTQAVVRQRQLVREATAAVNKQFERNPSRRAVFEGLTNDATLDPATLKVALDIANVRGDITDGQSQLLIEAIEAEAGIDFDDPGAPPTVPAHRWVWNAYRLASPGTSLVPVERMVKHSATDDSHPHAHYVHFLRAKANARMGRWQQADADFTRALELVPEETAFWQRYAYRHACLLAYLEQWDRYDQLCQKAVSDFEHAADTSMQEQAARMCLFSTRLTLDAARVGELADAAHEGGHPYPPQQAQAMLTKATADLRREEFESAIEMLDAAADEYRRIETPMPPLLNLYRAIVHTRLGQQQEAQAALQTAIAKIDAELPDAEASDFPLWWDWIVIQIVRREAEEVVSR